jgi:recombinational DNA repair protein (RecF pathway)
MERIDVLELDDGENKCKYHARCYVCATCETPLADKGAYPLDNQIYCKKHREAVGKKTTKKSAGGTKMDRLINSMAADK